MRYIDPYADPRSKGYCCSQNLYRWVNPCVVYSPGERTLSGSPTPLPPVQNGEEGLIDVINRVVNLPTELQIPILIGVMSEVNEFFLRCMIRNTDEPHILFAENAPTLYSVAFSPNGSKMVIGFSNKIQIWDIPTWTPIKEVNLYYLDLLHSVTFSPDGSKLAIGAGRTSVQIWDVDPLKWLRTLHVLDEAKSVVFSPDGSKLAARFEHDGRVWETNTWKEIAKLSSGPFAFSPDGSKLAVGDKILDTSTWNLITTLKTGVVSLAFSPDGSKLAVGTGRGGGIGIWDTLNWNQIHTLPAMDSVSALAFSPDGSKLAAGFGRGIQIPIWDVPTGELVITLVPNTTAGKMIRSVDSVAFSPDGSKLVAGFAWGSLQVWDISHAQALRDIRSTDNPSVLLLLYVLYKSYEVIGGMGIDLSRIEQEFKDAYIKKFGGPIPYLLEFTQIYTNLPVELQNWIKRCFNLNP